MSDVTVTFNEFASAGAVQGLRAAIVTTCIRIRSQAVFLAPVKFGELANSIMWRKGWGTDVFSFPAEGGFNEAGEAKHSASPLSGDVNGEEGIVGTNELHGIYVELGTRYMQAQPYLRPAGDHVRGRAASDIAKEWGPKAMALEFAKRKTTRSRG